MDQTPDPDEDRSRGRRERKQRDGTEESWGELRTLKTSSPETRTQRETDATGREIEKRTTKKG